MSFQTEWGSLQGADPATPQQVERTTTGGLATATVIAGVADPPGSTWNVTGQSLMATDTFTLVYSLRKQ